MWTNMKIEKPPEGGRLMADEERKVALSSWVRIVAPDGSTIAYTPDEVTARVIVNMLE